MSQDMVYEITAALVALSVVLGAVILSLVQVLRTNNLADIPGWLAAAVGAVIGFYFGRRAGSNGVARRYVEPTPYVEESKHGV